MNIPKPKNFNKKTFRASSVGKLMGEAKSKSSISKLEDKNQEIAELEAKMKEVVEEKRNGKAYLNQEIKLGKLQQEKEELESIVEEEKNQLPQLPDTCISYLIQVYVEDVYGIKENIHSKYFEKGLAKEEEGIALASEAHDCFYMKCDEPRKFNDFFQGECDILHINEEGKKKIVDIKNCWDLFTFFKAKNKETKKEYKYQGIVYLKLYDAELFNLVYTLCNMPENLQVDECKRILYGYGSDMEQSEEYILACQEFFKKCNFDNLLLKERIYDDIKIELNEETELEYVQMCERVKLCRRWLNNYSLQEHRRIYGLIEGINDMDSLDEVEVIEEVKEEKIGFVELVEVPIVKDGILEVNKEWEEEIPKIDTEIIATSYEIIEEKIGKPILNSNNSSKENKIIEEDFEKIKKKIIVSILNADTQEELHEIYEQNIELIENDENLMNQLNDKTNEFTDNSIESEDSDIPKISEEEIIENLSSAIENSKSVDELNIIFNNNIKLFEHNEDLKNAISNKSKSLQYLIEETSDVNDLLVLINKCNSEKEILDLYKKNIKLYQQNETVKEKFDIKKKSLKEVEVAEVVEEKPTPKPVASPKPTTTKPTASPSPSKKEEKEVVVDERYIKLLEEVKSCKTAEEIKQIYKIEGNKEFINSNKSYKKEIEKIYVDLDKKEKGQS